MPSAPSAPPTDPHAALASRFHAALEAARQALTAHAALLPSGRLGRFDALIADFERNRVRIAVYGEVKAGKSTLVNALAGRPLSPASFGPLTSVPVRITYGPQTTWSAAGAAFDSSTALAEAMRGTAALDEVTVTTELDLLHLGGQLDLVDTPGVGSDDHFDAISAQVLARLDAVILIVRYPALFTRFTRHLMQQLEADIGKLFVVWNLDAACAELPPEELAHQVDGLKRNVAGVHELYTVDARAALDAAASGDGAAREASGLPSLIEGLSRFARSGQRQAVAVREAAKRAEKWLQQADEALQRRKAKLHESIQETRRRLEAVRADADAQAATARAAFERYQSRLRDAQAADAQAATEAAARLRKQLRQARRGWFGSGDGDVLLTDVVTATQEYANEVDAALARTTDTLREAAQEFGTVITAAPRERVVPFVEALGPDERLQRATEGKLCGLRRRVWRRWYLPGFEQLWSAEIDAELAARAEWRANAERHAEAAGQASLDARLSEIERRAENAAENVRRDRRLAEEESELAAVERDAPIVRDGREQVQSLAIAARALEGR